MLIPLLLLGHFIVFACLYVFRRFFYCVLIPVRLPSVPHRTALFTTLVVPISILGYCPKLYSISLGIDAGCPLGLILTGAAYKRSLETTVVFDCMIGAYKSYDSSIKDDATARLHNKWSVNGLPGLPPSRSSDPMRWDAGPSSSSSPKTLAYGVSAN